MESKSKGTFRLESVRSLPFLELSGGVKVSVFRRVVWSVHYGRSTHGPSILSPDCPVSGTLVGDTRVLERFRLRYDIVFSWWMTQGSLLNQVNNFLPSHFILTPPYLRCSKVRSTDTEKENFDLGNGSEDFFFVVRKNKRVKVKLMVSFYLQRRIVRNR